MLINNKMNFNFETVDPTHIMYQNTRYSYMKFAVIHVQNFLD